VHGISKTYRVGEVEVQALRGVELDLYESELVVLLGASGSGKSTLLNILGGLDVPSDGEVYYLDHKLTGAGEEELTRFRREHVGFVFQFYNLVPSLTALENVELVTNIASNPMDPQSALSIVELSDRVNHFPAQLSGGEQQRVAIARAIAKRPDVLLCDEPTGALDSKTGIVVLEALKHWACSMAARRIRVPLKRSRPAEALYHRTCGQNTPNCAISKLHSASCS
jgi:putative ABC transport system ATP-binding protein